MNEQIYLKVNRKPYTYSLIEDRCGSNKFAIYYDGDILFKVVYDLDNIKRLVGLLNGAYLSGGINMLMLLKEKLLSKEQLSNIIFENYQGKTLGECSDNVAEAIVKEQEKFL